MARLVIPQPTFFHDGDEISVNCEKNGTEGTGDDVVATIAGGALGTGASDIAIIIGITFLSIPDRADAHKALFHE